jgi:DHA2 family multidrug resistance protein-like MFS transporter
MSSELGGALGIALLGSVVTMIYRGTMAGAFSGNLPPGALEAARGTLGGALSVAEVLHEPLGATLVTVSRSAFVEAFQAAALAAAAIALIAAAATALFLDRHNAEIPTVSKEAES